MNILLTGSTGFIGSHILGELIRLDYHVTACVREPASPSLNVRYEVIDFVRATDVKDWLPLLDNIDVVINSVGIISESKSQTFSALHTRAPVALFRAAEVAGVRQIIQISALGADEQAQSHYHLSKREADEALQSLSLSWYILRPSLVYGHGAKSMGLFRAMAALPVVLLIDDGGQQIQAVYIDDLVAAVISCLSQKEKHEEGHKQRKQEVIDIVGPDVITFNELLLKQRTWLGLKKTLRISISSKYLLKIMPLIQWLNEPSLSRENIEMLQRGNISKSSKLEKHLQIKSQSMAAVLSQNKPSPADYWYARLYFMRPLLQLGLAFVWVWTALVSAFFYPQEESYQMLKRVGISEPLLPFALYGAAFMDFILGVAMFFSRVLQGVLLLQIVLIVAYTLLITVFLPEYWLHPFGEITKNIPMILSIMVLYKMTGKEGK